MIEKIPSHLYNQLFNTIMKPTITYSKRAHVQLGTISNGTSIRNCIENFRVEDAQKVKLANTQHETIYIVKCQYNLRAILVIDLDCNSYIVQDIFHLDRIKALPVFENVVIQ